MKCVIIFVLLQILLGDCVRQEICEHCVPAEQCQAYTNMNKQDQDSWNQRFPCENDHTNKTLGAYGFAAVAKGDYVCCPSSQVWGVNTANPGGKTNNNNPSSVNSSSVELQPEYGYDQPNMGRYPYGNQNSPNNRNYYGNPRNPNNYGNENYPQQNGYDGQRPNYPGSPGNYGGQGQYPTQPGYGGPNYGNTNRPYRPGQYQNPFGGLQNPSQNFGYPYGTPGNQYPYGGRQNRPSNQNGYNNPGFYGRPSYPSSNTNGFPWGNEDGSPDYQNYPQNNGYGRPNGMQPGNSNPGINSGLPNHATPGLVTPGLPTTGDQNSGLPGYQNPQSNLPGQVTSGIANPGTPIASGYPNTGYQNNPETNLPNPVQPGITNPKLPSTIDHNPSYQPNPQAPVNPGSTGANNPGKPRLRLGQECKRMKTSFPPSPETGCCGRDMSDAERVTDLQSLLNMFAPPKQNTWNPHQDETDNWPKTTWPTYQRRKRSVQNETATDVSLDNRIAGGRETELDQFPWTVLMKTTFDYGTKVAAFSCGGSLISRRYVLTAGHCVYEPKARISDIEVTLAEYDKRTFPIDCITVFGGGRECVKNILMHAEDVVHHPEYDDDRLLNDIALVRLNAFAPYTRYIRPICLPTINVDVPEFSNLPLAVAGWGRDHQYVTDIKQSTVVHLVPPDDCKKSYPHLTKDHLCAAGRTGEDTCKGDSGGPLMMLYKGSYYVIGVVSGKRADSPCGSKVPSLYTNVYHYIEWIRNTIRE